jgi:hypothetical protein
VTHRPPESDGSLAELARLISGRMVAERIYGNIKVEGCNDVTGEDAPAARSVADAFARLLGLKSLGEGWFPATRTRAAQIVTGVLARDMAYAEPVMPRNAAEELAEAFFALLPPTADWLTNLAPELDVERWTGGWNPVTESTFDACVVGIWGDDALLLCIEDED